MRTENGWSGEPIGSLRVHGPNTYPCYGYVDGYDDYHMRQEVAFLYAADVEIMLSDLTDALRKSWA
jgi:hypothetical protein